MNILMLSVDYPPVVGGIGTHVYHLSKFLARKGCKVNLQIGRVNDELLEQQVDPNVIPNNISISEYIYSFRKEFELLYQGMLPENERMFEELDSLGFFNADRQYLQDVVHYLQKTNVKFDLIHTHDNFFPYTATVLKKVLSIPLVTTLHFNESYTAPLNVSKLYLMKNSDKLICVSNDVKQYAELHEPKEKLVTIYNGIEFTDQQIPKKRKYKNLVYCGRILEKKGIFILLQAFAKVKKMSRKHEGLKLTIVGKGEDLDAAKKLSKNLEIDNSVIFAGYVPNEFVDTYYREADLAIVPSFFEPFGIVACEAMREKTCVIASNVGGLKEIISDGVNGYLVEPQDVDLLAEKIDSLLNNDELRNETAERAYKLLYERFGWDAIASDTLKLYDELLSNFYGGTNSEICN